MFALHLENTNLNSTLFPSLILVLGLQVACFVPLIIANFACFIPLLYMIDNNAQSLYFLGNLTHLL